MNTNKTPKSCMITLSPFRLTFIRLFQVLISLTLLDNALAQQKRLYIANDDHTDYFWTADGTTYQRVFQEMIDYYLELATTTATNPPPYQSRFNCDGSFWLWTYEKNRTAGEFAKVMDRIKDGHLSAPLNALVSSYGGQSAEAVLRGMYYSGHLERRFNHRFTLAVAMENQSLPLGLASLWAGAGAKYSWRGVCGCASRLTGDLGRRPHEIYWASGADGRRVLMKWHSLANSDNKSIGGYAEAYDPVAALNYLDTNAGFLSRYTDSSISGPYLVRGAFGFGWDALERRTGTTTPGFAFSDHFHVVAKNQSTTARQVITSNEEDFFKDFEASYGANLPSESITYGNEWELYSASMAETSARVRRTVEKLRAAEAMSALVTLQMPDFQRPRSSARDLAFMDLGLYWEHDWTADGPVSRSTRAAFQENLANEIEDYVTPLHRDAAERLGALIGREANTQRFYVFNPLGWNRTEAADFPYAGTSEIHVTDLATGADVPHQLIIWEGTNYLRILASGIPSVGYKAFEVGSGPGTAQTNTAATFSNGNTLENGMIKVVLDADGAISSLIDQSLGGSELAGTVGGLRLNDFAANNTNGNPIILENSGPVSVTLKCVSTAGKSHTTRVTVFRNSNRVDIRNDITQNFTNVRHWAFSFNLAAPIVRTEEIGAVIRASKKSAGGDYADTHARYDYLTLNHFADMTDGANQRGITLANADCSFARLGNSTTTTLDTATPQLSVLAGGQVDGENLGIQNQNGATQFLHRFSLRAHAAYDQLAAMKFGLESQNPFVSAAITGGTNAPYPSTYFCYLTNSNSGVLLWALKTHDDGPEKGIVARLWNQNDAPSAFELTVATGPIVNARTLSHIETSLTSLPVTGGKLRDTLPSQRMQTYAFNAQGPKVTGSIKSGFLTLSYSKPKANPQNNFTAESSLCPEVGWSSSSTDVEQRWQVIDQIEHEMITARDTTAATNAPSRFMRLDVTPP